MKKIKVAIVKQYLDPHGPWKITKTNDLTLLKRFYYKTTFWEMGTLFDADWYIIKDDHKSPYLNFYHSQPKKIQTIKKFTVSTNINKIQFNKYDVVISLEPFLNINKIENKKTLFAYFLDEVADPRYYFSLQKPLHNYDLFLDHILKSRFDLEEIPSAISFPYPRNPKYIRKFFVNKKSEQCWVDRRVINDITKYKYTENYENLLQPLKKDFKKINITLRYKMDLFAKPEAEIIDPNKSNDSILYLKQLAQCKYYFCPVPAASGQALVDAAGLKCICIGYSGVNYHKLVCHPKCLVNNIDEGVKIIKLIQKSLKLQREIINYQETSLNKWFVDYPNRVLAQAVDIKRTYNA